MENKIFSSILNWLRSTEMFARPSKQIPGKWQLFEYYMETGNELLHFTEDQLNTEKVFWHIEFKEDDHYSHKCNLPVSFITKLKEGNWSISKNYITFISPEDFRDSIEFQFAIVKGALKLLKKDAFGRIEFFGFFNRPTI
jgi:hypothetical protein